VSIPIYAIKFPDKYSDNDYNFFSEFPERTYSLYIRTNIDVIEEEYNGDIEYLHIGNLGQFNFNREENLKSRMKLALQHLKTFCPKPVSKEEF